MSLLDRADTLRLAARFAEEAGQACLSPSQNSQALTLSGIPQSVKPSEIRGSQSDHNWLACNLARTYFPEGKKIHAIKLFRTFTSCGLRESKEALDHYWDFLKDGRQGV